MPLQLSLLPPSNMKLNRRCLRSSHITVSVIYSFIATVAFGSHQSVFALNDGVAKLPVLGYNSKD